MTTSLTATELLQALVRIDTTNPPGNEIGCITYLNDLFKQAGIATKTAAKTETRPNLIARLPGRGEAPPVLWQAHVDVVTTQDQVWQHPPFSGEIVDGYLWGRGSLDDKCHAAMMVSTILRAHAQGIVPPGDIVFAALADEEAGGVYGAKFLAEQHPELFEGVRYAIGEGGGFSTSVGSARIYPIMVAEKQICTVRLTFHGDGGHGAMPVSGEAMARLGRALQILDRKKFPVHVTPVMRQMIETIAQAQPPATGLAMRQILNPALTDRILGMLGKKGQAISAALHNTASPTLVQGGHKINVIPSEITLDLDGRLLPDFVPEDMVRELKGLLGRLANDGGVDIQVINYEAGPKTADMGRYTLLADLIHQADPQGTPCPYLVYGVTDARHFARLGIQSYGFVPLQISDELISTPHNADERIPVASLEWGAQIMMEVLQRFQG